MDKVWRNYVGHKIRYYAEDLKHQYGVTYIVWKGDVGCIISCTSISSRLISIPISARPYNIIIIQVHAPMSVHEQFHETLDSVITKTPKKNILVVQCDWNAKVGTEAYKH